jgi:hypothetical protein
MKEITENGITLYFDGKLYYGVDNVDNCAYVHGAEKSLRRVVISDTVEIDGTNYAVKSVASNAFKSHNMQSITIGDEVMSIENGAFCGCLNLESVCIGKSLQKIGVNAFAACDHLTTINFPSSLQWIGHFAFCCCDRLNDIYSDIIDPCLCTVERTAFDEDTYQRVLFHVPNNTIELYQSLPNWNKFAHTEDGTPFQRHNQFSHSDEKFLYDTCGATYSLDGTKLISVPKGIVHYEIMSGTTTIGQKAFQKGQIEDLYIPDSITTIEDDAFADCIRLQNIILPNSITCIGSNAFEGCSSLREIVLPHSLEAIRVRVFKDCTSLENVYIPDCVEYIDVAAFMGCTSLTSVVIPCQAIIESSAFQGCSSLTAISLPILINEEGLGSQILEGCKALKKISYPYRAIPERMFGLCVNLEEIDIWGRLYYVDDSAFYYCNSLRKVVLHCHAEVDDTTEYENFWRFSKRHNLEFVIPHGSEDSFKRLYEQAAGNPNILINVSSM